MAMRLTRLSLLRTPSAGAIDREQTNEQLNALGKAVNDFDFEAALSKLDEITEKYGAAGERGHD